MQPEPIPTDDLLLAAALVRALRWPRTPVLLAAEPGVQPERLVADLALRAGRGVVPHLADARFVLADARHVPPEECPARLASLLADLGPDSRAVAVVEGFVHLLRHGTGRYRFLAALPALQCRLVALASADEADALAHDDPELASAFFRLDVPEPEPDVARPLVAAVAVRLASECGVSLGDGAVDEAVALTARFVPNERLPGKAVAVLARACRDAEPGHALSRDDVVRTVALQSGVPESVLRGTGDPVDYAAVLGASVVGQDAAVRAAAGELGRARAGLTDGARPASVMLFLGPTGTGKTELARAIARSYAPSGKPRIYPLANFAEAHAVASVVGVPPGYVGHDRPGRLVADLRAEPYGVFLLDEADKAHPDVLQPFLHAFDEGWVADQRGTRADASRAIFVLTANVGARMVAEMHREGKSVEEIAARMREALGQIRHGKADRPAFAPEFLARIDRIAVFPPLGAAGMARVAELRIESTRADWRVRRGKFLEVPPGLVAYLGTAAHRLDDRSGGKEGARIVRKLVAEWIEGPIQRAMAADPAGYRGSETVRLEYAEAGLPTGTEPLPMPEVAVRFLGSPTAIVY